MKVQLTSVFALIAMSGGLTGGAALAQSDSSGTFCDTGYLSADENSDGVIDKQELQKVTEAEFSSLDANEDGTITRAEYTDCRGSWSKTASNSEPMTAEDISAMDTNQDGNIDQDEYMAAADQEYMARWGETGTAKEVRDADFAPATPENKGGVGYSETASDSAGQGGTSTDAQQDASNTQSGTDQSDMTAQSGSDDTEAGATADTEMQAASGQEGQPQLVLRRVIFVPAHGRHTIGDMSRDEVAQRTALQFLLLDANRNRMIDPQEQQGTNADQASMDAQMSEQFDRADADKSGDLSRDEYTADMQARWDQAQSRGQASASSSDSDVGAPVVYYRYPHPF